MHRAPFFLFCIFTTISLAMELPEQKDTTEDRFILDDYRPTSEELRNGARPSDIITLKYRPYGRYTLADINAVLENNSAITTIEIENAPNTTFLTRLQLHNINHVCLSNCSHIHMGHLASLKNNHNRTPTFIINYETIRPYFWHEAQQQYHVPAQMNDEIREEQYHTIQYWPNNQLYVKPPTTQIIDVPFLASIIEPLPDVTSIYLTPRIITKEGLSYALSLSINYTLNISHLIQNHEMISPVNTTDDNNDRNYMEIERKRGIDWGNQLYNNITIKDCKNTQLLATILEPLKAMPNIAQIELSQCTLDESNLITLIPLTKKVRLALCTVPFLSRPSTASPYSDDHLDILTDNSWYIDHTKIVDGVQLSQLAHKMGITKLQLSNCSFDASTFAWTAASSIKNIYHSKPSISRDDLNPSEDYPGINKEGNELRIDSLRFSSSAMIEHLQNELADGQTVELSHCLFDEFNLSDLSKINTCTLNFCSAHKFTSDEAEVVYPVPTQYNRNNQFCYEPRKAPSQYHRLHLNNLYLLDTRLFRMIPPMPDLWVYCRSLTIDSVRPYDLANSNAQVIDFWSLTARSIAQTVPSRTKKFEDKLIIVDRNSTNIKTSIKSIFEPTTKDILHERWRQIKKDLNNKTKRKPYITNSAYAAAHALTIGASSYACKKFLEQESPVAKLASIPTLCMGIYSAHKITKYASDGWKWFWDIPHANRVQ